MGDFMLDLTAYLTARWPEGTVVYVDDETLEVFIDDHVFTVKVEDDINV